MIVSVAVGVMVAVLVEVGVASNVFVAVKVGVAGGKAEAVCVWAAAAVCAIMESIVEESLVGRG